MTLKLVPKGLLCWLLGVVLAHCAVALAESDAIEQSALAAGSLSVTGAGSTFAAPIIQSWITVYPMADDSVKINYSAIGSGEGIQRFLDKQVDFAATDAPLSTEELASAGDVEQLPLSAGMIGITYNMPELGDSLKLSREAYAGIFLGIVDRWNDPLIAADNPGLDLPAKLIQLVVRADSSGTTNAFTEHLSSVNSVWAAGPGSGKRIGWPGGTMQVRGNEGVAGRVKMTLGSIGYVESGFADRLDLPMAQLENFASNYVSPTVDAGKAALASAEVAELEHMLAATVDPAGQSSYPIIASTWFVFRAAYDDPLKHRKIRQFLRWSLSQGQRYAEPQHYIPLPAAVSGSALSKLGPD